MSGKKLKVEGGLFDLGDLNKNVNNDDVNVNQNVNKKVNNNNEIFINIVRPDIEDEKIRMTYHLKVSTIRKIKLLARKADMGVSEFLQTVLDVVLDKIVIKD
jgi:hypothetical protein